MTNKIHLIQELFDGTPNDEPKLFYNEDNAGKYFEEKVSSIERGFRKKQEQENWLDYRLSFTEYTYSDSIIYDTNDWELHWYQITSAEEQPIVNTSFPEITQEFTNLEMHPCKMIDTNNVEQCDPAEAQFWSLYIHLSEGGLDCIGDFATEKLANNFKTFLESFITKHTSDSEGSITWCIDDFSARARDNEMDVIDEQDPALYNKLQADSEKEIPAKYRIYDRRKFKEALHTMISKHDCTSGISWDTIDYYLEELCRLKPLIKI